ncbi:Tetratricopeptide repeat protein 19, mitochondrial [Bagarius yarrelli]|uniref:Tetratricopeptide repeat protein 19, mitochondrial n=1 Tax=Bagarius yarrelli TaxID=175774 RepID=A0A556TV57_BAGYA|nr:Tetratricopeptide repeat protein 19, mitochondrial [Bagarius yarrelli]
MALPCSCRIFMAQRQCIKRMLGHEVRTVCMSGLSHRKPHYQLSVTPPLRDCRQHRNAPSVAAEGAGEHTGYRFAVWSALAFSLFGSKDERSEAQKMEDEIILLLKKAKYSMMLGELDEANVFLHKAIRLSHQSHNNDAIIYTYSLMANLAFIKGELDNAEKLFKAAMSYMLSGGTPQDDNAVIEMSLKLASIYATQNKNELAEHGFQFCTESLEAKIEKQKDLSSDTISEEERKDTRLLLGLSLDARARYLASLQRLQLTLVGIETTLETELELTLVLMSDLATVLDLQGKHDEALAQVRKAVELGQMAGHPDQHVLLGNMAGILMHKGEFEESVKMYKEAMSLAQTAGDAEAVEQFEEGLKELNRRKEERKESLNEDPLTKQ